MQLPTYSSNYIRRDAPPPVFRRPVRESSLTALHGWLLMLVLPFAVLWIPLVRAPGLGNLTILDLTMLLLWGTTLLQLGTRSSKSDTGRPAFRIAVYAFAPALFGCLGALLFDPRSRLTVEFLQHAKRFGLPGIIPLAMLMLPAKRVSRIRVAAVASLLIMVLIPYTPIVSSLPISDFKTGMPGGDRDERPMGSLSNSNDFGYIALLGALIGLSHAAGARGKGFGRRSWATVATAAGLGGIVASASRSGLVAAIVAAAYIVSQSKLGFTKKLSFVAILAAAMIVGWQVSSIYRDRMAGVLEQKIYEPSTFARIEAQEVAFRTWLQHPLGVGFSNMSTAASEFSQNAQSFTVVTGSDSIYFDFLLGTGALGLLCIILCFRNCWMLADVRRVPMEAAYLKAGMLGAFCFGLATVSPASFSVAPFFFTVAGLAGCARRDYSLNEARRA